MLKEKITNLKFSENDKETINYLENCQLNNFSRYLINNEQDLAKWDAIVKEVHQKLQLLQPQNDLLTSWLISADFCALTIIHWIEERSTTNMLRREIERIRID